MTKTLAERVEERIRNEWPGPHYFEIHGHSVIPPIRKGGVTDGFVNFVAKVISEETEDADA